MTSHITESIGYILTIYDCLTFVQLLYKSQQCPSFAPTLSLSFLLLSHSYSLTLFTFSLSLILPLFMHACVRFYVFSCLCVCKKVKKWYYRNTSGNLQLEQFTKLVNFYVRTIAQRSLHISLSC